MSYSHSQSAVVMLLLETKHSTDGPAKAWAQNPADGGSGNGPLIAPQVAHLVDNEVGDRLRDGDGALVVRDVQVPGPLEGVLLGVPLGRGHRVLRSTAGVRV